MSSTIKIQPQFSGWDSKLVSASPNTAYDLDESQNRRLTLSSGSRGILQFPLRKVPHQFTTSDTSLTFFVISGSATVTVYPVTERWDRNVSWNNRLAGTPWSTPGGVFGPALFSATLGGTNAFSTIGVGVTALRQQVDHWLDEFEPNYGFLIQASGGTVVCYAMNDRGESFTEQSDTSVVAADRWTKYHPCLKLVGDLYHLPLQNFIQGNVDLAVEPRATRWSLAKPSTALPQTLAGGLWYLDNPQPVGDLLESFAIRRARSSLDAKIDMQVGRDKSSDLENPQDSRSFYFPMEVLEVSERVFSPTNALRYVTVGMGVIDGDRESRVKDVSSITLQCRDPAIYGLISTFEGKFNPKKIPIPAVPPTPPALGGVGLTRHDSGVGYWIFYYQDPTRLEQVRNWVSDPAPTIWVQNGTNKKFYTTNDQISIKHGLGEIWIEKNFYSRATSADGMGNPTFGASGNLRVTFLYWASPLDDFYGSLPLNVAMAIVLKDGGYQHQDASGFLYLKALPPVLGDFVFDQVTYDPLGFSNLDLTLEAQHESGATLALGTLILNHVGDALYFKLDQANGRFNWIYFIPYQPAIGGTYVWEVKIGGVWTAITPFSDLEDPEAWLRGTTDPGADQLQNGGLITFKESVLAGWQASEEDFGFIGPITGGFWMRVRCTVAPTQGPIIHRFAGKEVLTVGKDKQSTTFRHYDETHHFELVQQMLHRWGVPNYLVSVDRFGDVVGQYLVQKSTADYQLTDLASIEVARDSTQIYTEVHVLVKEFNNESVLDYASLIQGGVASHAAFDFVDQNSITHNTADFYITDDKNLSQPPNIQITLPIDGAIETDWGLRYRKGTGKGPVDTSQILGVPVLQIDFATTISLMGIKAVIEPTMIVDIEAYNPDTATWSVLPGCSNLGGRVPPEPIGPPNKPGPIDFTSDPSPDRPIASKIRFILKKIRQSGAHHSGGITYYENWDFWFYQVQVFGVAQGEVLEGIAILGTTPPFNTPADQALMARYGKRVFTVQNNAYITTKKEANRVALDTLRELAHLYDPLIVTGIYPLSEIGETVKVIYAQMGISKNYMVEEFDRSPLLEYRALLTDYRFTGPSDPPIPVIPNRTDLLQALAPTCLPSAGAEIGLPTGTMIWNYDADSDTNIVDVSNELTFFTDLTGHNRNLNPGLEVGPQYVANSAPNNLPSIHFLAHTTIGDGDPSRWVGVSQPIHAFYVYQQNTGEWINGTTIARGIFGMWLLQHGSSGQLAANGGDGTNYIYLAVPLNNFHVVEVVMSGAMSKMALDGGSFVTGDTGIPEGSDPRGFNFSEPSNNGSFWICQSIGYQGELDGVTRSQAVSALKAKWGIS